MGSSASTDANWSVVALLVMARLVARYGSLEQAQRSIAIGVEQLARTRKLPNTIEQVSSILDRASTLSPIVDHCLSRAIVGQALCQRIGVTCELKIGIHETAAAPNIQAHAWLVCDGHTIIGDVPNLHKYAQLTRVNERQNWRSA
jgi:hypothetical protein